MDRREPLRGVHATTTVECDGHGGQSGRRMWPTNSGWFGGVFDPLRPSLQRRHTNEILHGSFFNSRNDVQPHVGTVLGGHGGRSARTKHAHRRVARFATHVVATKTRLSCHCGVGNHGRAVVCGIL